MRTSISIKFNIFEGERILVERVNILGNNVTNESVIRELLLDEGDPFTDLNLEKSISKIKAETFLTKSLMILKRDLIKLQKSLI